MCSLHDCCDHGIHSERNTPSWRHGPDRPRQIRDSSFGSVTQTTVSQPREVTRLRSRPDRHGCRDNPLHSLSDSRMNSRSDINSNSKHVIFTIHAQPLVPSISSFPLERKFQSALGHKFNSRNGATSASVCLLPYQIGSRGRLFLPYFKGKGLQAHVVISGKVQGFSFRKWTVENATKLGVNGWVRNCKDGTVEAVFSGKPSAVDHLLEKCKSGPSRARVANVAVTPAGGPPKKGFEQLDDKRW